MSAWLRDENRGLGWGSQLLGPKGGVVEKARVGRDLANLRFYFTGKVLGELSKGEAATTSHQ